VNARVALVTAQRVRDIEPVLPVADSPTLAYEVIDYIVSVGTVRSEVVGRIIVK
jgi:hypothetical protein